MSPGPASARKAKPPNSRRPQAPLEGAAHVPAPHEDARRQIWDAWTSPLLPAPPNQTGRPPPPASAGTATPPNQTGRPPMPASAGTATPQPSRPGRPTTLAQPSVVLPSSPAFKPNAPPRSCTPRRKPPGEGDGRSPPKPTPARLRPAAPHGGGEGMEQ